MTDRDDTEPASLTDAARAAQEELERFEALVASVRKIELTSEKSIIRASKVLADAVAVQARIAEALAPLARAFSRAQQRELGAAEALQACAVLIHERTELLTSLMEGIRAVGSDALEVTTLLKAATGSESGPGTTEHEFDARVAEALGRMDSAVERAKELHRRAREAGLGEVARQAQSLEQQLISARGKLKLGDKIALN
jgi:hypothetical protein